MCSFSSFREKTNISKQLRLCVTCSPTASRAPPSRFKKTLIKCVAGALRPTSACWPRRPAAALASRFAIRRRRSAKRASRAASSRAPKIRKSAIPRVPSSLAITKFSTKPTLEKQANPILNVQDFMLVRRAPMFFFSSSSLNN